MNGSFLFLNKQCSWHMMLGGWSKLWKCLVQCLLLDEGGSEFSLFQCWIKMVPGVESITEKRDDHVDHWSLIPPQVPESPLTQVPSQCVLVLWMLPSSSWRLWSPRGWTQSWRSSVETALEEAWGLRFAKCSFTCHICPRFKPRFHLLRSPVGCFQLSSHQQNPNVAFLTHSLLFVVCVLTSVCPSLGETIFWMVPIYLWTWGQR